MTTVAVYYILLETICTLGFPLISFPVLCIIVELPSLSSSILLEGSGNATSAIMLSKF